MHCGGPSTPDRLPIVQSNYSYKSRPRLTLFFHSQDVDGTNSRLAAAQRKMNQVFKKAGTKGQMVMIAVLTGILIVLFLVAFM